MKSTGIHHAERQKMVFIGDSITAAGRSSDTDLGHGYVTLIAETLGRGAGRPGIHNRGINGHRVRDLVLRWERDVSALDPWIVTVAVGINDTWRRYDRDDPTSTAHFHRDYHALLKTLSPGQRIVLIEPFVLPVGPGQEAWHEDLDPKIDVVRSLAKAFAAVVVPAGELMRRAAKAAGAQALAPDGVHPSDAGHRVLAAAWLDATAAFRASA